MINKLKDVVEESSKCRRTYHVYQKETFGRKIGYPRAEKIISKKVNASKVKTRKVSNPVKLERLARKKDD